MDGRAISMEATQPLGLQTLELIEVFTKVLTMTGSPRDLGNSGNCPTARSALTPFQWTWDATKSDGSLEISRHNQTWMGDMALERSRSWCVVAIWKRSKD